MKNLLTGKCREMFENWLVDYTNEQLGDKRDEFADADEMLKAFYETLIPSMQWGVIQDFADSLNIEIATEYLWNDTYYWKVFTSEDTGHDGSVLTRQEARNAAIEKLNEVINQA